MKFSFNIANFADLNATDKFFLQNAVSDGLTFVSTHVYVNPFTKDDFLKAFQESYSTIHYAEYVYVVYDKTCHIKYNAKYGIFIAAFITQEEHHKFMQKFSPFMQEHIESSVSVEYFYLSKGSIQSTLITLDDTLIDKVYPDLYPDIDIEVLRSEFQSHNEPILFFTGIPGVGKTSFIRYLLKQMITDGKEHSVAYVKDMSVMVESEFWSTLSSNKYDIVVFDDLDFALAKRVEGNNGFVNNLLSYTDGMFGRGARVLITSNIDVIDIDAALLRPGRCFDFIELHPLAVEDAKHVWTNVLGMQMTDFLETWKQSDHVTQASIMSYYERLTGHSRERTYIKRGERTYSVEEKIKNMSEKRKVGFLR